MVSMLPQIGQVISALSIGTKGSSLFIVHQSSVNLHYTSWGYKFADIWQDCWPLPFDMVA